MKNKYYRKWILQRLSAFILIPLTFWFIYHCINFKSFDYFEIKLFFNSYVNSFLFLFMMISMIFHSKIGCDTIIQDYVSLIWQKKFFFLINIISIISLILTFYSIVNLGLL